MDFIGECLYEKLETSRQLSMSKMPCVPRSCCTFIAFAGTVFGPPACLCLHMQFQFRPFSISVACCSHVPLASHIHRCADGSNKEQDDNDQASKSFNW